MTQLTEGKYYKAANGEKWGPVERRPNTSLDDPFPWIIYYATPENPRANKIYRSNGVNAFEGRHSLIAEWIEEEVDPTVVGADIINHPPHYTGHPSGVECIAITEHMNFCRGNAMKYLWRAGEKGNEVEDLKKARWYIDREISRLSA